MQKHSHNFYKLFVVAILFALLPASIVLAQGLIVEPGAPGGGDWMMGAGLRIKGQPGPDIYLGVTDLGAGGNRVSADAGNPLPDGTYPITFDFDPLENRINASIPARGVFLTYDFDDLLAPGCPAADWDVLDIVIKDYRDNAGVSLENLALDGNLLGNFAPGGIDVPGKPGYQQWNVTGFDFSQGFSLTADLTVENLTANESVTAELLVGCLLQANPRWDINADGITNVLDLTRIGEHWLETGAPGWIPEDVNEDGIVNVLDLTLIGAHWLEIWS